MKRKNIIFGLNFSVPINTQKDLIAELFNKSCLPLIDLCEKNSYFKFCLFLSRQVYDFLEESPDLFQIIKALVSKRNIEILSSGIFEPVFSFIPYRDYINQLRAFSEFLKNIFGSSPSGIYLTGDVWDYRAICALHEANIEYAFVDEKVLSNSIPYESLEGYYVTECEGKTLKIFPNLSGYFKGVISDFSKAIKNYISSNKNLISMILDLSCDVSSILNTLRENIDFLSFTTPTILFENIEPSGNVHIYSNFDDFVNFIHKNPDVNILYKKMLFVSEKVKQAKEKAIFSMGERDSLISIADARLWMGQNYYSYMKNLTNRSNRNNAFSNLIVSENVIDKLNRGNSKYADLSNIDIDKDGFTEIVLSNEIFNVYLSRFYGQIFELDYKPKSINLFFNPEVNSYRKVSLVDKIFGWSIYDTYGLYAKRNSSETSVVLSSVATKSDVNVKISKTIGLAMGQSILNITYEFLNQSQNPLTFEFSCEFNISTDGNAQAVYILSEGKERINLDSEKKVKCKLLNFVDDKRKIIVLFDMFESIEFACLPVFSAENKYFEGVKVEPKWIVSLNPNEKKTFGFCIRVEE